jgi:hypothetical protein
VIREVRKKWCRVVFKTNCPKRLWTHGVPYVCAIMRMTASHAGQSQGRTPIEAVLGETPDVSEHLDFGFYDWVWFKRDAGIGEIEIGKWVGVSKSTGSLMSYHVLPITGAPASRTTVQRVTELEKQTEANQQRIAAYDTAIAGRFKEGRLVTAGGKPDLAAWSELLETDPDFAEEFARHSITRPFLKQMMNSIQTRTTPISTWN